MDIKEFKTDRQLEEDGVWVPVDGQGARIKVARMNNPRYKKHFQRITKPYRRQIRSGTLSEELAEKLLVDAIAQTILLDWEGFTKGGKKFSYSLDNAKTFLAESTDFRELVTDAASEMETFRAQEVEEAKGN